MIKHKKELVEYARHLKLPNLAEHVGVILHEAQEKQLTYSEFLADCLAREIQGRERKSYLTRLKLSGLPAKYDLDLYDYDRAEGMDNRRLRELRELVWVNQAYNLLLVGPSGAGKTFKDWPEMAALPENLIVKVVSEIHDPVTTTDELIPSGETSSYRSNPLGLAEFTLSRKDPAYVGRAKEVQKAQKAIQEGKCPVEALPEMKPVMDVIKKDYPNVSKENLGVGSTIFAVKPGDGSAREQAASCQKVLGGWANIANEYATKRYRSNLINWGMLPFLIKEGELPFANGDYLFFPQIRKAVEEKDDVIRGYVVGAEGLKEFEVALGELTDDEREIILKGCLINYNRK